MKDPIRHCELYKYDGCAHVDGFLCEVETCKERLEWVELQKKNLKSFEEAPENKKWEKRV
jgi:hypothetical protein